MSVASSAEPAVGGRLRRAIARCRANPGYAVRVLRGYTLFQLASLTRRLLPIQRCELGPNVRIQRNGSIFTEPPSATVSIGADSIVYEDTTIEGYGEGRVSIGSASILGGARIASRYRVSIGARFLASWNVFIQDFDPHPFSPEDRAEQVRSMVEGFRPRFQPLPSQIRPARSEWRFPGEPIVIGDDVWVGANVTILKGVTIGSGSIVATGSVVTRGEYPPRSIIAGNPARFVKEIGGGISPEPRDLLNIAP